MSHMKAMLIDDDILITGSSNFDLLSYRILKELVIVIYDQTIINDFKNRILDLDFPFTQSAEFHSGKMIFRLFEKALNRLCLYFNAKS